MLEGFGGCGEWGGGEVKGEAVDEAPGVGVDGASAGGASDEMDVVLGAVGEVDVVGDGSCSSDGDGGVVALVEVEGVGYLVLCSLGD